MAEWWQNPAYDARLAAGQVQTPGLVDWGGMWNDFTDAFNAPYNERKAREAREAFEAQQRADYAAGKRLPQDDGPRSTRVGPNLRQLPGGGRISFYDGGRVSSVDTKTDRGGKGATVAIPESAWQTTQSSRLTNFTPYRPMPSIPPGGLGSYSAQPRIASNARSAPAPRVAAAPGVGPYIDYPKIPYMGEPNRLPPSSGMDLVQRVAFNLPGGGALSGSGFNYPAYTARPRTASALDAINQAAPVGPSFPLRGGGAAKGDMPPNYNYNGNNYRASMRRAPMLPSGGQGEDIIRLPFDPMSETSGINMANSAGRGVAGPNGITYYPTNQATGRIRAPMSPVAERATQKPTGLFGGLFGGTGGLFGGGMFGGGQQAPRTAAGLPIATAGPVINGATYGITATGSVGDYGSSPGQITAGLQPGERKYDASTNSWGLR